VSPCHDGQDGGHVRQLHRQDVAAQVEFESKIEAKLTAIAHISVSRDEIQAVSTWV
jgi:hypothetical protein